MCDYASFTYEASERRLTCVTSEAKISQLSLHFGQIKDDVIGGDVSMNYTLFFTLYSSVKDISKEPSAFIFSQEITLVKVFEQVTGILWTLLDKREVISVFEDFQQLDNVRVTDLVLIESFDWDLSTINLQ